MKIRTKISLVVLFVGAIFIIGGTSSVSYYSITNLQTQIRDNLENLTQARARQVEVTIDREINSLKLITSRTKLRSDLSAYNNTGYDSYKDNIRGILDDALYSSKGFKNILVADLNGNILVSTDDSYVDKNISEEKYFKDGKEDNSFNYETQKISGEPVEYLSGPLVLNDEVIGVMVVESTTDNIISAAQEYLGVGKTEKIYVIDDQMKVVIPPALGNGDLLGKKVDTVNSRNCIDMIGLAQKDAQMVHELHREVGVYPDYRGINVLGTHYIVQNTNWCLMTEVDESEIFGPVNDILRVFFVSRIVVLFVFFIVVYFATKIVTDPIRDLQEGVEIVEKGDLDHKVGTKLNDEIGQLSRSFDRMTVAIKRSRRDVDRKVREQTKKIKEDKKLLEEKQKAILNVLEDVQEEKEKAAREKEKDDAVLYSIGDGVFVIDEEYKIVMFNKAASDLSGYSPEYAVGKKYDEVLNFIYEVNGKKDERFIKDAFRTGKAQEMRSHSFLITKRGKKIAISDSAAPLKDDSGRVVGCVVVFRDVTKEREIDKAKSEFVSLASHQLRTPLTSIGLYSEMLLKDEAGKLNKKQRKYLDEIYKGNYRMVALVNALLNVSRLDAGIFDIDAKPTDIKLVTNEVLRDLDKNIKKKKIKLTKEYDKNIKKIDLDPKLIRIIFQNLLSNSIKYTPENGSIKIRTKKQKNGILITISDTGYGIPKHQQKKIFTKMFRADNIVSKDTTGTGLGLYIVRSIVEKSGGKIWFDSEEDKGSIFYVSFPLSGMKSRLGSKNLSDI